jgi:hypothetical protein
LYDLALEFQERSQTNEARLLEQFEDAAVGASGLLGELVIVDDDDERLVLTVAGEFRAEVVPEESEGTWRTLAEPDALVEFYDPTDVFGDLADALAEAYPAVAPDYDAAAATPAGADEDAAVEGAAETADADAEAGEDDGTEDDEGSEDDEGAEGRPTA